MTITTFLMLGKRRIFNWRLKTDQMPTNWIGKMRQTIYENQMNLMNYTPDLEQREKNKSIPTSLPEEPSNGKCSNVLIQRWYVTLRYDTIRMNNWVWKRLSEFWWSGQFPFQCRHPPKSFWCDWNEYFVDVNNNISTFQLN